LESNINQNLESSIARLRLEMKNDTIRIRIIGPCAGYGSLKFPPLEKGRQAR